MKTVLCASFLAAVGSVSHVAHAGPTASAPGSFNDGNISFVLGIDTSQRVWENSRSYGGTYVGWSQLQYTGNPYFYTQVNGIYLSTHNMLGALSVSSTGQPYANPSTFGSAWQGWNALPTFTADAGTSIAAVADPTHDQVAAYLTHGSSVWVSRMTWGYAFGGWRQLSGSMFVNAVSTPAVAHMSPISHPDLELVCVTTSVSQIYCRQISSNTEVDQWTSVYPPGGWNVGGNPLNIGRLAPAVGCSANGTCSIFATDQNSGRIVVSVAASNAPTTTWSNWAYVGTLTSFDSPFVTVLDNGTCVLFATDKNGNVQVTQASAPTSLGSWSAIPGSF